MKSTINLTIITTTMINIYLMNMASPAEIVMEYFLKSIVVTPSKATT